MNQDNQERLLHRYLDGELSEVDAARFAQRMLSESDLRERVEAERGLRGAFAAVRRVESVEPAPRASAGFVASVLTEVRRLPARDELQQQDAVTSVLKTCRRVLMAAAVLAGIGMAWHVGLLDRDRAGLVEAAPSEVQEELERLDELIRQSDETAPGRRGR